MFSSSVFFLRISSSLSSLLISFLSFLGLVSESNLELFFFSSLSLTCSISLSLSISLLLKIRFSPDCDFSLSNPSISFLILILSLSLFFPSFFLFLSLPNLNDSTLSSSYFIPGSDIFIFLSSNSSSSSSNSAPEFIKDIVISNKISKKFWALFLSCSRIIFSGSISISESINLLRKDNNKDNVSIFSSSVFPGLISSWILGRRLPIISKYILSENNSSIDLISLSW